MVNVLTKKIDNVNSTNFHTVNLWIVELTLSSAAQTEIVSFRHYNIHLLTYTYTSKSGSVCNTNCN